MPESSPAAHPRPFFLARLALAVVLPVIVYASLRPFEGWRDPGRSPFAFWTAPLLLGSAYDALLNVVGYVAFAASLVLALFPRVRALPAFTVGVLLPGLCSALVETAQNYLPGRTASVVDVATNTGGAVLGAALAVAITPWLIDHRGGSYLRQRWLAPGRLGEVGLVVMGVWGVALFAQRMVPFAVGDIRGNLQREVDPIVAGWIYPAVESVVVALNLVLAALVLRLVLAERVDRPRWMLAFAGLAVALRLVAQLAFWHAGAALRWLTPAVLAGLLAAVPCLLWCTRLSRRAAAWAALVLLGTAVLLVNVAPPDPAIWQLPTAPRQQTLISLALVARYSAKAWPLLALAFLVLALRQHVPRPAPLRS